MSDSFDCSLLKQAGIDNFISPNVEIRRPALFSIGSHCAIDSGFYCTVTVEFGDYIHIGPHVTVIGGVQGLLRMGHFTNIAAGGRVVCGTDEYLGYGLIGPNSVPKELRDKLIFKPVIFENFANVGTNVVIHPGVTLAEGSVVGSCSLVTKDTEPWTIYAGTPARPIRMRPKEQMLSKARELGYL
jgi:acetyltransferase-like isoleucine patch superfamily enzyme